MKYYKLIDMNVIYHIKHFVFVTWKIQENCS